MRISLIFVALLLLCLNDVFAQNMLNFEIDTHRLEVHADSLRVNVTLKIPEKYMGKKHRMEVVPMIGDHALTSFEFFGEKQGLSNNIVNYRLGGVFHFEAASVFHSNMIGQDLNFKITRWKGQKTKTSNYYVPIQIITTSKLYKSDETPLFYTPKKVPQQNNTKDAVQDFYLKTDIDSRALNTELEKIQGKIPGQMESVHLIGYYPANISEKEIISAQNRTKQLSHIVQDQFSISSEKISHSIESVNYELLLLIIKEEGYSEYELIERIIMSSSNAENIEKELSNILGKNKYHELIKRAQRNLIRIKYIAAYTGDSGHISAVDAYLNRVNLEPEKRMDLLKKGVVLFPENWELLNNLACEYIQKGLPDSALVILNRINQKEVKNVELNKALALQQLSRFAPADSLYQDYTFDSPEVSYNYGVYYLRTGNYVLALQQFGSKPSFNKALCQVLIGETEEATRTLRQLERSADIHYLWAIALVREGIRDGAIEQIGLSIEKDESYRLKAERDLEFFDLRTSRAFMVYFRK